MENATGDKEAEFSGSSDGPKSSPYQQIVIACPDNHIIAVKRFTSEGEKLYSWDYTKTYVKETTLKNSFSFLAEVKVKEGRLVAIENKKGR